MEPIPVQIARRIHTYRKTLLPTHFLRIKTIISTAPTAGFQQCMLIESQQSMVINHGLESRPEHPGASPSAPKSLLVDVRCGCSRMYSLMPGSHVGSGFEGGLGSLEDNPLGEFLSLTPL
ncbi:hypothetical protein LINGRAHAP2_LOCUS28035 [Linum grandiflorum]